MAKRQHIPRPRHIFPELAAAWIMFRRGALYLGFGSRNFVGHIPAWIVGAMAGVASIMLAIFLLFLPVETTALASVQPEPIPTFPITPVIQQPISEAPLTVIQMPIIPVRQNPFRMSITRSEFPEVFDERIELTSSSLDRLPKPPANTFMDAWRQYILKSRNDLPFESYLARSGGLPITWGTLMASETVPLQLAPDAVRSLGVMVEKNPIGQPVVGLPFSYDIVVANISDKTIEQLFIRESISELPRVTQVMPSASVSGNELVWSVNSFEPGTIKTFRVTLVPEIDEEIRTVTRILPATRVSAKVNVQPQPKAVQPVPVQPRLEPVPTQPDAPKAPELRLTHSNIPELKQGENLSVTFSVTNVGNAPAEDVCLYIKLSGEFEHRYGDYVQHRIRRIEPGETRRALLQAIARDAGHARISASLTMGRWEINARDYRVPITPELAAGKSSQEFVNSRQPAPSEFQPVAGTHSSR